MQELYSLRLTTTSQAAHELRSKMRMDVEEFWALALTSDKKIIARDCLFRGTADACFFHPRDVFRFACCHNAAALIVGHNHPSGDPRPSNEDLELNHRLLTAADLLCIPVIDHIIVTQSSHCSLAEYIKRAALATTAVKL